ncbi:MAG: PilZ domain-containing protein [Candidatus Omnitrophica bacterium]|nr:PilZ domain-containing protein [Candidatus Omnitrophota bacterium]
MLFNRFLDRWIRGYSYENTRQYPRLPASWPVKCKSETMKNAPQLTTTKDISAGGVAVRVSEPLATGSRIRLEILVLPLNRTIEATGRVLRCAPIKGGGFEAGVLFVEIDPQEKEALKKAIEEFYGSRLPSSKRRWWRRLP